jgi:hypothetical protein
MLLERFRPIVLEKRSSPVYIGLILGWNNFESWVGIHRPIFADFILDLQNKIAIHSRVFILDLPKNIELWKLYYLFLVWNWVVFTF